MPVTTWTFTLRAGVTLVDATVTYNGAPYDVDAQLAAGAGSIVTTDQKLASLLIALRAGETALLDVNGVTDPGSPSPPQLSPVFARADNFDNGDLLGRQDGEWVPVDGRGAEIAYAEITTSYGSAALATTTADVTGLSVTFTSDGVNPIEVAAGMVFQKLANAGDAFLSLRLDGTTVISNRPLTLGINGYGSVFLSSRRVFTAGAHTVQVRLAMTSVGGIVHADNAVAWGPAAIWATRR